MTLRPLIRAFDAWLSCTLGVFAFCQDPECLLRLQMAQASHDLCLPSLTVRAGEPVLLLHLWNERIAPIPPQGPDLGWARPMQRRFVRSLRLVAEYIQQSPQLVNVRAVGGVTVLTGPVNAGGSHLFQRLGFTVIPFHRRLGAFGEFWENFYTWQLIWAYNPTSLRYKGIRRLKRAEIWMSAEAFLRRYG
jgi:hypothetical protein